MPPTEDALNNALDDLLQTELLSFTADPTQMLPFGQSTLRWNVKAPPNVRIKLNGSQVAAQGSMTANPVETRNYTLTANSSGGLTSQLAQVTVAVDTSACVADVVTEANVRTQVLAVVNAMLAMDNRVVERRPTEVEVTPEGIELKVRLEVKLDNKPNPDFNIDALIGVRVDENGLVAFFRKFDADLDFSFWEDVLIFSVGAVVGGPFLHLAIAIAESNAQSEARQQILAGIQNGLNLISQFIPEGWAPHRVIMGDGQVDVWRCPQPGRTAITSFKHPEFTFRVQCTR